MGYFFGALPAPPSLPHAIAFIDGQNLFRTVKNAFGYVYPNYDVTKLAASLCRSRGWTLARVHFYTGVPHSDHDAFWNAFWNNKVAQMGRDGVVVYTRSLARRSHAITCTTCQAQFPYAYAEEKGIDVRLAVDVVALAYQRAYDVAVIFSQDQDLAEVVPLVKQVASDQHRWIKLASAFPEGNPNMRGVDKTDWIPFDKLTYDASIDPIDYRPKSRR